MTITHIKEPLQVTCSNCNKNFFINYSQFHKQYYQKNNLEYWTEQESDTKTNTSVLLAFVIFTTKRSENISN